MDLKPIYPKNVNKNPFYSGMLVGILLSSGIYSFFFVNIIYGFGLLSIFVMYYYKKEKDFN